MGRELRGAVIVITSDSRGIGRAAALEFAERGSRLVLAARGPEPLRATVAECEARGAEAIVVPTDVRDEAAIYLASALGAAIGGVDLTLAGAPALAFTAVAVGVLASAWPQSSAQNTRKDSDMDRYANKNVVITGGSTGIGLTTAQRLVQGGARVLVTGRSPAP